MTARAFGVGLVLLVALVAGPAPARAVEKAIWGPPTLPAGGSAFRAYADLGVDVYQLQLEWAKAAPVRPTLATQPGDGAYKWPAAVDEAIGAAAAHDMKVALLVRNTPGWANGGNGGNVGPTQVSDFADFLIAARQRYPAVDRWMIWGETNRRAVWASGPVAYSELLDAGYWALKAPSLADPGTNTVVGGMTFTFGETPAAEWIQQMKTGTGLRPRFDEYGHNPFGRRCPDLANGPDFLQAGSRDISDVDTLREDVRAGFGAYKPLWLSEFTVSSDRTNRAFNFFVSRGEQAVWLARAFDIAGRVEGVSGLGWFNLADENRPNGLTTGLLDASGIPKPAYGAYRAATTSAAVVEPCPAAPPEALAPPPPADPGGVPTPLLDTTAPGLRYLGPSRATAGQLLRGIRFRLMADEAARASVSLHLAGRIARRLRLSRTAARPVRIARGSRTTAAAGTIALRVRPVARVRSRLKRMRNGKVLVRVVLDDPAGNRTALERSLRLRR